MKKHTDGHWVVREVTHENVPGRTAYAIDFNEDQEQVVDWVYEKADALLIAAAPDLLEALEKMILAVENIGGEHVTSHQNLINQTENAYRAISKAKGEAK